jgi:hypothetical protein
MNERWHELIQKSLDGSASEAEARELSALLRAESKARELYLQLADMHSVLAADENLWIEPAPARGRVIPLSFVRKMAAALMLSALVVWWFVPRRSVTTSDVIGTVTSVSRAQSASGESWRAGTELKSGRFSLDAGTAEITLRNGVRIVFEAPGELELFTPMRALLHRGQAVVRVPTNAIGFQLDTPAANIIDLGTEFAVKTGPGPLTDVQVFEGVVETTASSAAPLGTFPRRIAAGEAVRFVPDSDSQPQSIAFATNRFVRRLPADPPIELDEQRSPHFNETRIEEMLVLRREQPIHIDGDLSEWSSDGTFRATREGYSGHFVEGRMRFDNEFLYIAAHIGDPAPMRNVIDPTVDPELGWRGGGLQVRVSTDRVVGWPVDANAPAYYRFRRLPPDAAQLAKATNPRLAHLTMWHHAPTAENCLHIAYGMDLHGGVPNPTGFRGAFSRDEDGRGYTLEYAIPWSLLSAAADPPTIGDTLAVSWTAHWSDEGGRLWRGQLVELRNAAEPTRIHTWERAATWGRAVYR